MLCISKTRRSTKKFVRIVDKETEWLSSVLFYVPTAYRGIFCYVDMCLTYLLYLMTLFVTDTVYSLRSLSCDDPKDSSPDSSILCFLFDIPMIFPFLVVIR